MQSVLVCAPGRRIVCVNVPAFSSWRTLLLQQAGFVFKSFDLVVLKIRNVCVSIDHMVADYVDATEGEIQLHIDLPEKGGALGNHIGATEGRNVTSQQQQFSTEGNASTAEVDSEDWTFFTSADGHRTERNAPAAEGTNDSLQETNDSAEGTNDSFGETHDSQEWNYITSAPGYSSGRNSPAAEETTSFPETRQQSDLSQERIEAKLGILPIVKTANQAKPKQSRKKKSGKRKKGKRASKRKDEAAKPAAVSQDECEWDPVLIFKDKINLLSPGCKTPFIKY
jgi:hypothetical protein